MKTQIYTKPNESEILLLGTLLREGQLVAIPTETVYGLGANGLDDKAVKSIYEAKGRPADNPLILHVSGIEDVPTLVKAITPTAQKLMETFWPGPLTITLEKSDTVPMQVTGGLSRVALRCPDNETCRKIIKAAGVPIAAPSANRSGRPSPTTAMAVMDDLDGRIAAIADDGPCRVGIESTVVECGDNEVTILRPGEITEEMLLQVVAEVKWDSAITTGEGRPKAPGMKYRHYAPDGAMATYVGSVDGVATRIWKEYLQQYKHTTPMGMLISHEVYLQLQQKAAESKMELSEDTLHIVDFGTRENLDNLAGALYETLHQFNRYKVTSILAEGTEPRGVGIAVMNRMRKASSNNVFNVNIEGDILENKG